MKLWKLKKNGGAALISVLIGVMFIAILGTTILYAATMNYEMKVMRYRATDNFYTAEFGLDEVTADISKMVSESSDPIKTLRDELKTTSGSYNVYDVDKLKDMMDVSNQLEGVESVSVDCIYRSSSGSYTQDTYVESGGEVKLLGVQVTATTDDDHGNYTSTITTDVAFYFPVETEGTLDVNDFSILTNGSFDIMDITQCIGGCLYLRDNGLDKGSSERGYALHIHDSGVVYVLGFFSYCEGNVLVNTGSSNTGGVLFVGGDMYVNGDVTIDANSMLYVTGKLYVRGNLNISGANKSPAGNVISDNWNYTSETETHDSAYKGGKAGKGVNTGVDWKYYEDNYNAGLAAKMFEDQISIRDLGAASTVTDFPVVDFVLKKSSGNYKTSGGHTTVDFGTGLGNLSMYLFQVDADGYPYNDSLVFGMGGVALHNAAYRNATVLNLMGDGGEIQMSTGSNVDNYYGSMSKEAYEAAKSIFFMGDTDNGKSEVGAKAGVLATTADVMSKSDLALKGITVDDGIFMIYAHRTDAATLSDAAWQARTDYDEVIEYTATSGAKMYCSSNVKTASNKQDVHYYIAGEHIINKQSKAILDDFASGGLSGSPSGNPVITYTNWTKE